LIDLVRHGRILEDKTEITIKMDRSIIEKKRLPIRLESLVECQELMGCG